VVFLQRPPWPVRLAAYLSAGVDLVVGAGLIFLGVRGLGGIAMVIPGAVMVVASAVLPWILLGVRYEIEESELRIRRGPFTNRIPLATVDEVRIAAPLPSLTGVVVTHHKGARIATVPLFPADPDELLRHVQQNASELEVVETGVLRRRDGAWRAAAAR
jgi:hypothetical protein